MKLHVEFFNHIVIEKLPKNIEEYLLLVKKKNDHLQAPINNSTEHYLHSIESMPVSVGKNSTMRASASLCDISRFVIRRIRLDKHQPVSYQ